MKKIISVLILSFLLTGCSTKLGTFTPATSSTAVSQDTIDQIKAQVKTELQQELENQYRNSLTDTEKAITQVVSAQSDAVLGVSNFRYDMSNTLQEYATGSGVVYKHENNMYYLVTNNHVVDQADQLQVVLPNKQYLNAAVVGTDEVTDLAVVKFSYDGYLPTVTFGNSDDLVLGQFVIAVGNPLGYDYYRSVTLGIVSGFPKQMTIDNSAWDELIQHDAAINPGNSGGALFDIQGNLVGINNMKIVENTVNGMGFAIPVNTVKDIVAKLEANGTIVRPMLGIRGGDVSTLLQSGQIVVPDGVTSGVYVSVVEPSTGAADAGIQVSDIIIEANGTTIDNFNTLKSIITSSKVGDVLHLKVNRNGQVISLDATLKAQ